MHLALETEYRNSTAVIWQGNATTFLESLKPNSVSLIVSSPPYFMGKEYDKSISPSDFIEQHTQLIPLLARVLKPGGSLCWQVGHHVRDGSIIPLDFLVYEVASRCDELVLRNRIVWTFNHGANCSKRFSGRHETILWYTKGQEYIFNLDEVRVPQKYPGKRYYKGPKRGQWSGNPLGKNPGDVWEIPNVKAKHPEKTSHPCQFPSALVQRLIRALTSPGDLVIDPFLGSGTTCVVALREQRNFVGCELKAKYVKIADKRIKGLSTGEIRLRPDKPIRVPSQNESVAKAPPHFAVNLGDQYG